jgi:hypothetical protein
VLTERIQVLPPLITEKDTRHRLTFRTPGEPISTLATRWICTQNHNACFGADIPSMGMEPFESLRTSIEGSRKRRRDASDDGGSQPAFPANNPFHLHEVPPGVPSAFLSRIQDSETIKSTSRKRVTDLGRLFRGSGLTREHSSSPSDSRDPDRPALMQDGTSRLQGANSRVLALAAARIPYSASLERKESSLLTAAALHAAGATRQATRSLERVGNTWWPTPKTIPPPSDGSLDPADPSISSATTAKHFGNPRETTRHAKQEPPSKQSGATKYTISEDRTGGSSTEMSILLCALDQNIAKLDIAKIMVKGKTTFGEVASATEMGHHFVILQGTRIYGCKVGHHSQSNERYVLIIIELQDEFGSARRYCIAQFPRPSWQSLPF